MESHSTKFGRRHYAGPSVDMVQRTDKVRFSPTLLNIRACEEKNMNFSTYTNFSLAKLSRQWSVFDLYVLNIAFFLT